MIYATSTPNQQFYKMTPPPPLSTEHTMQTATSPPYNTPLAMPIYCQRQPAVYPYNHALSQKTTDQININEINQTDSDPGKFLLDSALNPTHFHTPWKTMHPITNPLSSHTACSNHNFAFIHQGLLKIILPNGKHLKTNAFDAPDLCENLLSFHELAKQYGGVKFTLLNGYVINTDSTTLSIVAHAPRTNGLYQLANTHTVLGFRTYSAKRPPLTKNPIKIEPPIKTTSQNSYSNITPKSYPSHNKNGQHAPTKPPQLIPPNIIAYHY